MEKGLVWKKRWTYDGDDFLLDSLVKRNEAEIKG
jgi:hypothetical protein